MFQLFKRNNSRKKGQPKLADLDGNPLKEGDLVESLRYELGKCKIVVSEEGYIYESLDTGKRVSWAKMIDATTENQKVRKIES
jgi:hypothetical protein